MTVISLARLQLALGALRLSEDYLTTVCPPVEKLLMRQRRLDRLQQLSDHKFSFSIKSMEYVKI